MGRIAVDVVLPTFNSAAFLPEQLDSILSQKVPLRILIRDDHSTDQTMAIVRAYQAQHGNISVLDDHDGRLGVVGNVQRLLTATEADFVLLCDADDIWRPHKAARLIDALVGHSTPALAHSDARVIDASGQPLASSLWHLQHSQAEGDRLGALLLRNTVTGCTAGVNRALLDVALPLPPQVIMHDWWLALMAAATGTIVRVPESLVDYRQHSTNVVGAHGLTLARVLSIAAAPGATHQHLDRTYGQAAGLATRLAALGLSCPVEVRNWAGQGRRSWWGRRRVYLGGGYEVPGLVRRVGYSLLL